jgi:hypothetical protein
MHAKKSKSKNIKNKKYKKNNSKLNLKNNSCCFRFYKEKNPEIRANKAKIKCLMMIN